MNKIYTTVVESANDGTDDLFITIPDEILAIKNWKENQAVLMEVKNGKIYITALPDEPDEKKSVV